MDGLGPLNNLLGWVGLGQTTANQCQAPDAFCWPMTPVTDQSEASMLSCQPMESHSAGIDAERYPSSSCSLTKNLFSEAKMHRVIGGGSSASAKESWSHGRVQSFTAQPPSSSSQFERLSGVLSLRLARRRNGIENMITAGRHSRRRCWPGWEAPHPLLFAHWHGQNSTHAAHKPAPSTG